MTKPSEILKYANEKVLVDEKSWTKGAYRRCKKEGDEEIVSYCSEGAILKAADVFPGGHVVKRFVYFDDYYTTTIAGRASYWLQRAIVPNPRQCSALVYITEWNDSSIRTFSEVKDMFAKAIALAEAAGE